MENNHNKKAKKKVKKKTYDCPKEDEKQSFILFYFVRIRIGFTIRMMRLLIK